MKDSHAQAICSVADPKHQTPIIYLNEHGPDLQQTIKIYHAILS